MTKVTGKLICVVGPSGVGKDTLIRGARKILKKKVFVTRHITRPNTTDAETHIFVNKATFNEMMDNNAFMLNWSANDLHYGISNEYLAKIQNGLDVIFNGSRRALSEIQSKYPNIYIIWITASKVKVKERLIKRGRESEEKIDGRLKYLNLAIPEKAIIVDNSGTIEAGIQSLVDAICNL